VYLCIYTEKVFLYRISIETVNHSYTAESCSIDDSIDILHDSVEIL